LMKDSSSRYLLKGEREIMGRRRRKGRKGKRGQLMRSTPSTSEASSGVDSSLSRALLRHSGDLLAPCQLSPRLKEGKFSKEAPDEVGDSSREPDVRSFDAFILLFSRLPLPSFLPSFSSELLSPFRRIQKDGRGTYFTPSTSLVANLSNVLLHLLSSDSFAPLILDVRAEAAPTMEDMPL